MKKGFGKIVSLSLTVVMSLSLAACGSSKSTDAKKTTALPQAPTAAAASTSAPAAVQQGGILKLGIRASINNIGNPGKVGTTSEYLVIAPAVETLARVAEDGTLAPFLCESFKEDPDKKTLTIKLRKDVKFHDGTILDAEAVKWNFENTLKEKGTKFSTNISYTVADPLTLVVNMESWDNSIAGDLLYNIAGYMISPAYFQKVGAAAANANPVGTGAYKFVSWARDSKIVYEKFNDYWGGKPNLDGMQMHLFGDATTTISAMRTGEIDGIMQADPEATAAMLQDGLKYANRTLSTGTVLTGFIYTSNDKSIPTYELKVRQALAHAIDVKAIAETFAKSGSYVYTNQWASPGSWSFNDKVVGYKYDVEKAKALLKEAGFENGFKLDAFTTSNNAGNRRALEMAQAYLSQVKVTLNINLVEQSVQDSMGLKTGWKGMMVWSGNGNSDCAAAIIRAFGDNGTRWSPSTYHPPELAELAKKALGAKTFDEKKQLTQQMNKSIIDDNCLVQPFYSKSNDFFVKGNVNDTKLGYYHAVLWTPEKAWLSKK